MSWSPAFGSRLAVRPRKRVSAVSTPVPMDRRRVPPAGITVAGGNGYCEPCLPKAYPPRLTGAPWCCGTRGTPRKRCRSRRVVLHRADHDPPDERVAARRGVARVGEPGSQVAVGVPGLGVVHVCAVAVEVAGCRVPVGEHLGRSAEVEVAWRGRSRGSGSGEDADVVTGADHGPDGQGERGQRRVADRPATDVQGGTGVVEHHHELVVGVVADRVRDDPGPNGGRGRAAAVARRPETRPARGCVVHEPPVLQVVGVLRLLGVREAVREPHRVAPGEHRTPSVHPVPAGVPVVHRARQPAAGVVGLDRAQVDRAQLNRGALGQDGLERVGGGFWPGTAGGLSPRRRRPSLGPGCR